MPPMTSCWYCNSELPETSQYCPTCGHSQTDRSSSPLFGVVDPVTGIWNSKFISALVGQEANRAVRYHRPLSVLLVELDHAEHIHKELEPIQIEGPRIRLLRGGYRISVERRWVGVDLEATLLAPRREAAHRVEVLVRR